MDRPSSHSQRVPYARKEGRKSLFSKMKDSMRDMLSPSWLTDLVHHVNKDSPTDDKNVAKGSDQMTGMQPGPSGMPDMTASQTPVLPPGPVGMMGSDVQQAGMVRDSPFKNRGTFVGNGQPRTLDFAGVGQGVNPSGTTASPFQQGNFPPPISEFTSAQLPLARVTEKSDSIMAQEDTLSQRSDGSKSTSGCSSMIPQADAPPRQGTVGDKRKAPEQVTLGGSSPQEQQAAKRQRLHVGSASNQTFSRRLSDSFVSRPSVPAMSSRPAFNTSLFGSPLNNESSLLGTSVHESSFYPGKTKFGGRSSLSFRSQRKNVDLNQSLPSRLSVPVKAFMKARPRLNPSKEAVTSSTAKRILEALDKMPTPINDAKRIPMVPRQWTESPSFFSRDTSRSIRSGPPTQKLNISSQASISKNRQVSFAPVQQPRASTSQVPEETISRPTRQDTVILSSGAAAPSGKMKRDKSYHRGSASVKATLEEEDTVIIPDLQTEFMLPVSSMPKFSFATPASQPKSNEPFKSSAVNRSPVGTESPVKQALNFTFSSPIIEPVPANKPASPQKYGGFQFSSPISVDKKDSDSTGSTNFSKPLTTTTFGSGNTPAFSFSSPATKLNMDVSFSTAPKPKPKINGPVEPAGGGLQAASELKQGSVMDILGGGNSSKSFSSSTPLSTGLSDSQVSKAPPPLSAVFKQSGWSCDVCLINNKDEAGKCVACQSPKPGGQKPVPISAPPPLSAVFKQSGWSCDVCLINNKDEASKCVACQSPKPGGQKLKDVSSTKTSDPAEPLKSDLFAKFKQPGGSWTCDTCLIQNKQDDTKCVACQTRKPGSASSNMSPLVSSIQPGNWICNKCLIQNKKDDTICGACKAAKSTPKPSELNKSDSLFAKLKPAAGTWECEVCLVQNKSDDNSCVACQTPKPLKFFKHPPGDWTCDTCLVNNKESAVNCVACNYARPGPPRTQTVPSIAKSYTLSQASGFNIPSTESGSITMSSTGGFKFTPATSASSTKSGFDVSKFNENVNKSTDSKLSSGGGFKFNSDSKSETSSSGFKFGTQTTSESDKSSVNTGGFKINAPSGDKPATGFQFGNSDTKSENKDGPLKSAGFQFGKSDSSLSNISSSVSNESTTVGGFVLGQKSDTSAAKDELQATTSVPGGFTFKSKDASAEKKDSDLTKFDKHLSSVGGFNFTSLTSTSNSLASTSSSSIGTFAFTATKVTDPSVLSGTSKSIEATKPAAGVFSFGQKPAESNTSNSPFSFAQKPVSAASPNKRGRDDDTGEPEVKKSSFSFGQTATSNSSTPFQFGANSVVTTTTSSSSSPFVFGQTPATTSAGTGLFAFGQQNSTPASTVGQPVFGLQNSAPASSAIPSVFGQQNATVTTTSSTNSNFVFGGSKAAPAASTGTALPVFGQTNSLAATTTASASTPSLFQFGQANSTAASTPFNFGSQSSGQAAVFGSGTPNFNFTAQKTETSTAASASGLFKFGGNPSQPAPATTPAFGSGSTFGSSSIPAFGTGAGSTGAFSGNAPSTTPAFGATPPAFGSSNSSTGQAAPAFGGVFGNSSQPAAPAQSNSVFQFGAKPADAGQAAPSAGFNFSTSANPAGLGAGSSFNFSGQAPAVNAFSATGPSTPSDGRKIKKAVRKIRR
ncbi:LOW QUALITY PROTEIN: nuclear pore complex protein Nup153-like [Mercenaria mercenaria]|uniref:LOW QUALITY PROTEIN: nuclear pore complex protein Nup153-like n=1 Tax=Mercenaria mercenaria TaxID=6596 RepID=UPI00234F04E8|nr:LOW QUALITY PROTEIN: nuclear pore complex protein Nup153-like [Mercenaria mercenaria]